MWYKEHSRFQQCLALKCLGMMGVFYPERIYQTEQVLLFLVKDEGTAFEEQLIASMILFDFIL